jgi:hypothetical protein
MQFCSEFSKRSGELFSRETLLLLTVLNRTSEVESLFSLPPQVHSLIKHWGGEDIDPEISADLPSLHPREQGKKRILS